MLPAHIIGQIQEREIRRRAEQRPQPTLELPLPPAAPMPVSEPETNRGVIIIDLM